MFLDHGKVVRDQRAEVGQRAARIDECNEQFLAPELAQMNGPPVLIPQCKIWNRIARRGHVINHRRLVIGLSLRHHHDMIQQHRLLGALRHQHVRGNHVPRVQFTDNAGVLELVRHRHCIHESGNRLVIQHHDPVTGIGRDDLAP